MKITNFKLERYFAKYEFQAPYILCASDCESFTVNELLQLEDDAIEKLNDLKLGYTESLGNVDLRNEVSKLYKSAEIDNIIIFSGAEEGIFIFMNSILTKDDHIIVQYPAYQSLYEVSNSIVCEITKWIMDPNNNWKLDLDFLEENIKKNTKAIVINFPHNPTGALISKTEYLSIIEFARDNNLYLFSDEVYRFLEYDQSKRLPSAIDIYDKAISLGVMSKSFGLAGLRINRIASFKDYTTICNSALSEFFAILALKHKDYIVQRNINIILSNLKILNAFFKKNINIINWIPPKAGSIAFPKLNNEISAQNFCRDLLKEQGVLLLPSNKFDYGDNHFRIGFGRKNILNALNRVERFIEDNYNL
jgi:aspartate/methionine/tyrosine aminotransferase